MSDLEEKIHDKVEVAETALEGVDTLWSKHPKKILLAMFLFLVYIGWQIRYEILDYTQEVKYLKESQEAETTILDDSSYYYSEDSIEEEYIEDTTQYIKPEQYQE